MTEPERRSSFARLQHRINEWRTTRPLLGGSLLIAGGLVTAYVPLQFTAQLLFIGGTFTIIGLLFATLVAFCGIAALAEPQLSPVFGVAGAAFATLSVVGALGGLLLGTVVGTAGGILCYAWQPPADAEFEETTLAEASAFIWGRTVFMWGKTTEFDWRTAATEDTAEDGSDD